MISILIGRLVEFSRRHCGLVAIAAAALVVAAAVYTARHVSIDTDEGKLISPDLPWRKTAAELNRQFPQNANLLAIVVDGKTPDEAGDAASALAARLRAQPGLFKGVHQPDASMFFRKNGLLFLPVEQVQKVADDLISDQALLGTLAADPNLRGVFEALDLMALGAVRGDIAPQLLDTPLDAVSGATEAALAGRREPLSWQALLSGRKATPLELRRFILCQPVLDFGAVEPGQRAVDAVKAAAAAAGIDGSRVRVRVTGPVALQDDQFATLSEGAGFSTVLSLGLLCFWLSIGLRSPSAVCAVLLTLLCGLVLCATFAVIAVGPFNPISVAFAPLFVGIAIDFGIQFSVRYGAEHLEAPTAAEALRRTSAGVGGPLLIAAGATSVGFLSFVPTDYTGVSTLGLIAGVGMLIALVLNLTLLPALLTLLGSVGATHAGSLPGGAAMDRFVLRRRPWILAVSALLAVAACAALPRLSFDFNPINLENPRSESVSTLFDLMTDPQSTPYTIDVLASSPEEAAALSGRLSRLPEVAQVLDIASFVPADQQAKLDILRDADALLGPTLEPAVAKPPPSRDEILGAIAKCEQQVRLLADKGDAAAVRFDAALRKVVAAGASVLPMLEANLSDAIPRRLEDMRLALEASPVSLATMPPELSSDWVGRDGRWRLQVFPRGDSRRNDVLRRFYEAVKGAAPGAAGTPVSIQETADMVTRAFGMAGTIAILAIAALLFAVLRRVGDIAALLAPLLLAGLLTLATAVAVGLPINFANIITLPLLLGIGVAFDIYFVMRWRAGEAGLLSSSTARAVLFSALTTGTAFGSLALSRSPGMADMGKLLSLALAYTLLCTLFVLPALLGPAPRATPGGRVP